MYLYYYSRITNLIFKGLSYNQYSLKILIVIFKNKVSDNTIINLKFKKI